MRAPVAAMTRYSIANERASRAGVGPLSRITGPAPSSGWMMSEIVRRPSREAVTAGVAELIRSISLG